MSFYPYNGPSLPTLLQDLALMYVIFKITWNVQIQMNSSTSVASTDSWNLSIKIYHLL